MPILSELKQLFVSDCLYELDGGDFEKDIEIRYFEGVYHLQMANYYGGIGFFSKHYERIINIALACASQSDNFSFVGVPDSDFNLDDFVDLGIEV